MCHINTFLALVFWFNEMYLTIWAVSNILHVYKTRQCFRFQRLENKPKWNFRKSESAFQIIVVYCAAPHVGYLCVCVDI